MAYEIPSVLPVKPKQTPDLTGMRFGKLTVLHYAGTKGIATTWCCRCDCGVLTRVKTSSLKTTIQRDQTRSCGCLIKERSAAALKKRWAEYTNEQKQDIAASLREARLGKGPTQRSGYIDAHLAAEIMDVSVDRVMLMAKDEAFRYCFRRGSIFIRKLDIKAWVRDCAERKGKCGIAMLKQIHLAMLATRKGKHHDLICGQCGIKFLSVNRKAKYCAACRKRVAVARSAAHNKECKKQCEACGSAIKRSSKYCKACWRLNRQSVSKQNAATSIRGKGGRFTTKQQ